MNLLYLLTVLTSVLCTGMVDAARVKVKCPKDITVQANTGTDYHRVKWNERKIKRNLRKKYGTEATLTLVTEQRSNSIFHEGTSEVTYRGDAPGYRSGLCSFYVHVIVPRCQTPTFHFNNSFLIYYIGNVHGTTDEQPVEPYPVSPVHGVTFDAGDSILLMCDYVNGYLLMDVTGPREAHVYAQYVCTENGTDVREMTVLGWRHIHGNNFSCVPGVCEAPEYDSAAKQLTYLGNGNYSVDFPGLPYDEEESFHMFDMIHVGCNFEEGYVAVSETEDPANMPLSHRGSLMHCFQEYGIEKNPEWSVTHGYSSVNAFECAYIECGYPDYDNQSYVILPLNNTGEGSRETDGTYGPGTTFAISCNYEKHYYPVNEIGEGNDTYAIEICTANSLTIAASGVESVWQRIYGNQFECAFCPRWYGMVTCNNTRDCISEDWLCDNWNDCGDYEDELNCQCLAEENEVLCNGTGKCIYRSWLCDGDNDCGDSEDESNCLECGDGEAMCSNTQTCIPNTWICDGWDDCGNNEDEENCPCEYECGDGTCAKTSSVCDGQEDCPGGEDEQGCTCEFACEDGTCISSDWVCDLYKDCAGGEDENGCPCNSEDGNIMCVGVDICIREKWICDGDNDCGNMWDEVNCGSHCGGDEMFCRYEGCVSSHVRCDGYHDCFYGEDEASCPCESTPEVSRFNCTHSDKCILSSWLCDGVTDCDSGEDEDVTLCGKHCEGDDLFTCHNHVECIPLDLRCNYEHDCDDGSDEVDCDKMALYAGQHVPLHRSDDVFVPVCADGWSDADQLAQLTCHRLGFGHAYGWGLISTSRVNESENGFVFFESGDESGETKPVPVYSATCPSSQVVTVNCSFEQCGISDHGNQQWGAKILNGYDAQLGSWPWQVVLEYNGDHICGGSILTPRWILTAAHCVDGAADFPARFSVRAGSTHVSGTQQSSLQTRRVDRVVMHERYNSRTIWDDIALVRLDSPLTFNEYVRHVCVPDEVDDVHESIECYTTGWGGINPYATSFPFELQEARMDLISDADCSNNAQIADTGIFESRRMQCAGYAHGFITVCNGDSGGPLMCRDSRGIWTQVGVVSWGPVDGLTSCMGISVFAEVLHYEAWIWNTVNT